jgi:hypothetical protein
MNIAEAQGRGSTPMTQEAMLDMLRFERLTQEWVLPQINHAHSEIVTGSPVSMNLL